MATWYVRPDTSHSATRNGTSYETAWGGPGEVVWGGSGVVGGDTLLICGRIVLTSNWAVGAHGGNSEATRCVLRGDYAADPGTVTSSPGGGFYLNNGARQYTDIVALTLIGDGGRALNVGNGAHYTRVLGCDLTGHSSGPTLGLPVANGNALTDLVVEGNTFRGQCSAAGCVGQFVVAAGASVTLTRPTIRGNRFLGFSSPRSIIHLRANATGITQTITDLRIEDNEFVDCLGIPIEVNSQTQAYGTHTGLKILRNKLRNCRLAPGSDILGGNVIRGFAPSTTLGFGRNEIAYNDIDGLTGQYGGFNLFFSTLHVHHNRMRDLSTLTIDGNGILLDHGNDGCVIEHNIFEAVQINPGVNNSGAGVMVLDSINCKVRHNLFRECSQGVYIGSQAHPDTGNVPFQSVEVTNNTIVGSDVRAFWASAGAGTDTAVTRNNVAVRCAQSVQSNVAWTTESNNVFFECGAPVGHTFGAGTTTDVDPQITPSGRPLPGSPALTGGADLGYVRDLEGRQSRRHIGAFGAARLWAVR
jgi:hypothetical protein